MGPFLAELKRRRVYRVAVVYAAVAFVIWQAAEIAFPALRLPDWTLTLVVVLTLVGFPIALILAWAFDVTPEGVKRTEPLEPGATKVSQRWPVVATLVVVTLLIAGGIFWWIRPRVLGPVDPSAQVIAVLPFNTSGPGVELLGEGMVDLFSANLNDVGGIRTVDSRTVMHRWQQRAAAGRLDLGGALALGRDVNAGSVLLGSVVSTGPEVRMTAELYSVSGDELARAHVDGPADSVLALVDGLGIDLLRKIWLAREPVPHLRVSAITTTSVDAIRAYLEGMQYYRRSEWDSAIVALRAAVEQDSTFALAQYKLASAYGWSVRHGMGSRETLAHGEAALRHADRLPTRERTLMAGNLLIDRGRPAALDTLEAYVASYPDDSEGLFQLADVRFHMQHIAGLDLEELYSSFEHVLELDPSLTPAVNHLLQLSLAYNDSARYFRYLEVYEAGMADPSEVELFRLATLLWTQPDSLPQEFVQVMESHPGQLSFWLTQTTYTSDRLTPDVLLEFVDSAGAAIEVPDEFGGSSGFLHFWRGLVLSSLGRLADAKPSFDSVPSTPPVPGAIFSLLPVYAGLADSSYAAQALESISRPPPVPGFAQLFAYFRMLYALSQGDAPAARSAADEALAPNPAIDMVVMRGLVKAGLGWADLIDGDTLSGLRKLDEGIEQAGYGPTATLSFAAPLRFVRAATLAARPETRDRGIRLLRYGLYPWDTDYLALRYLFLGGALEEKGDRAGAIRAYSRFIRLWENADPELQPRVETARRALERLTAEGTSP
jgi:tetratricopeptide (TPR) repeat protein/TolB-like protein